MVTKILNKLGFVLAIPFALMAVVIFPLTALIIFFGISVRRWSFKQGNSAAWQYLDALEKIRL